MTPPTLAEVHATHERLHYVCASCPRCRAMLPRSPEPEPVVQRKPEWLARAQRGEPSFSRDLNGRAA